MDNGFVLLSPHLSVVLVVFGGDFTSTITPKSFRMIVGRSGRKDISCG